MGWYWCVCIQLVMLVPIPVITSLFLVMLVPIPTGAFYPQTDTQNGTPVSHFKTYATDPNDQIFYCVKHVPLMLATFPRQNRKANQIKYVFRHCHFLTIPSLRFLELILINQKPPKVSIRLCILETNVLTCLLLRLLDNKLPHKIQSHMLPRQLSFRHSLIVWT